MGCSQVLQYQQGNCAAAVDQFERAAPLFDSQCPLFMPTATCLVKLKRYDKAADVFARGLSLNAGDSRECLVVAAVQLLAHQPERTIATLDPLLRAGQNAQALELASAADEDLHDTDKAVESLRQAILLDPQNVSLYVDLRALRDSPIVSGGNRRGQRRDQSSTERGALVLRARRSQRATRPI